MKLKFSASEKSDKSQKEVFGRIDNIDKFMAYEDEFEEFKKQKGNQTSGIALIRVRIFGKIIEGKMFYEIGNNKLTAIVKSSDMKFLKFGYVVETMGKPSVITQFVEFDTGNPITNLFAKIFLSSRIKRHLHDEILNVIK